MNAGRRAFAPLPLVTEDTAAQTTVDEIERRDATRVIMLAGEGALSPESKSTWRRWSPEMVDNRHRLSLLRRSFL